MGHDDLNAPLKIYLEALTWICRILSHALCYTAFTHSPTRMMASYHQLEAGNQVSQSYMSEKFPLYMHAHEEGVEDPQMSQWPQYSCSHGCDLPFYGKASTRLPPVAKSVDISCLFSSGLYFEDKFRQNKSMNGLNLSTVMLPSDKWEGSNYENLRTFRSFATSAFLLAPFLFLGGGQGEDIYHGITDHSATASLPSEQFYFL